MMKEDEIWPIAHFACETGVNRQAAGITKKRDEKIRLYCLPHAQMRFEMIHQIAAECNQSGS
jgi:hypothetical protein